MHVVIHRFAVDAMSVDAALARLATDVVPRLRAIRGFDALVVLDDGRGFVTAQGTFETREAAVTAREALDAWLAAAPSPVGPVSQVLLGTLALRVVSIGANHAIVVRCHVEPTQIDQAAALLQSALVPLLRSTRGFCSCDVIRGDPSPDLLVIGGFDTSAAADRALDLVSDWIARNLGAFLIGQPECLSATVRLRAVPQAGQGRSFFRGFPWGRR